LVAGVDADSSIFTDLKQRLLQYFARVEHCLPFGDGVHQAEFDAAIVFGKSPWFLANHLCVVQFGGPLAAEGQSIEIDVDDKKTVVSWSLDWTPATRAHQFSIPEEIISEGLASLVETTLIRPDEPKYKHISWRNIQGDPWQSSPQLAVDPFALDSAGQVLGARLPRSSKPDAGELWSLPESLTTDLAMEWIAAAVRSWGASGRAPFLTDHGWHEDPLWRTQEEELVAASLAQRTKEIEAVKAKLDIELEELASQQRDARQHADSHGRRLLTAQSDELVQEVASALSCLGFDVIDSDALPEHAKGRKQEDLRVSDGDWIAVAEVKGYARSNAKARDLLQLGKAVRVFAVNQGREPDAQVGGLNP
jgi:hypothetical protein